MLNFKTIETLKPNSTIISGTPLYKNIFKTNKVTT